MRCCKGTWQHSLKRKARIEDMSGVNGLMPDDALLEKFVNLPDLLARIEDDRELLADLFVMFQEGLPDMLAALHRAIEVGDLPEVVKAAHTLKGLLANLSMEQGARLAATIETAARAGDRAKVKEISAAFDSEAAALLAAVNELMVAR